jgi:hypothetical protein
MSSRRNMEREGNSIRQKMEKLTLLLIGSPTLTQKNDSTSSDSDDEDKKVVTLALGFTSLPLSLSSSRHLCLMAKGEHKLQNDDHSGNSDSDEEFSLSSYSLHI